MTRNEDRLIVEFPERWKLEYERKRVPCDSGYFSAKGSPYKPYANLKTSSTLDLVEDALKIPISRPYKFRPLVREKKISYYLMTSFEYFNFAEL